MSDLLQSDGWERFQRALGRTTQRVDGVLAIEMPLPFGLSYLYTPRTSGAPSVDGGECSDAVFLRAEFDPKPSTINHQPSTPFVLRHAREPEWTWRTSLTGTDDELLARMHEKHRYNVRLAARRGVTVRHAEHHIPNANDVDACWSLIQETAKRQRISTHPRAYYETMVRTLPHTHVYVAEHRGVPVASAIVAYHGDTATYLHGGSSHAHRALMAPHLLHVSAMRDAKAAGMRWYDWGGIESQAASRKPQASSWEGMTRFKQGFGGEAVHHSPMMDLVFRPGWYRMLAWLARLRV